MRQLFIAVWFLWFCPAVPAALEGAGAAGGYAIGPDYIQGETDKDFSGIYNSALDVAGIMGVIQSKYNSPSVGKIGAEVENSSLRFP